MRQTGWRTHGICGLILILPLLLFYREIVFQGFLLCGGDLLNQFIPWRVFALAEWEAGRFPFWNPEVFSGTPFAANIQTSVFYPFNLVHGIFSVERTFSLSLVFHHGLAMVAMYLFVWSLFESRVGAVVGALVWGWSGFLITHAHDGHLIHVRAYAFIPLVLYFQTKLLSRFTWGALGLMALCLAAMFYGGHTQIPLYLFYLVLFRALWWGGWKVRDERAWSAILRLPAQTGAALVLSLLLSALVLVPLAELSQHTAGRAGGAGYAFATSDSLPPLHLITLLAPFFYGDPTADGKENRFWETQTGYHEICGYAGIFALLLALLAFLPVGKSSIGNDSTEKDDWRTRECWFFFLLAGLGIIFSLGQYNPLYPLLYYGLPGWSYFRVPGRLVLLFILGISVCSARGVQRWLEQEFRSVVETKAFKAAAVFVLGMGIGVIILISSKSTLLALLREIEVQRTLAMVGPSVERWRIDLMLPQALFEIRLGWMWHSFVQAVGLLLLGCGALVMTLFWRVRYRWLGVVAILLLDGLLFSSRFIETLPPQTWRETIYPTTALTSFLQEKTTMGRVLCLDDAIGYPGLESHPELRPNRLMRYGIQTVRGYDPIILKSYVQFVNRLYQLPPNTHQGGLLFFPSLPNSPEFYKLSARWIVTGQSLPPQLPVMWRENQSAIKVYENPDFVPQLHWAQSRDAQGIVIRAQSPEMVELDVTNSLTDRLVFLQNAYPGWRCEVDENMVPIHTSDGFMAVDCPEGTHHVRFFFCPVSFFWGGGITVLTGLVLFFLCAWEWRRNRTGSVVSDEIKPFP
ncbi:MAG: hypothetical protein RBU29_08580 [bacterium]|nr:hypothetical protein [bacterium]